MSALGLVLDTSGSAAPRLGRRYETITRAATALMAMAEGPPEPRTEALLAPRGMGHDTRCRLGEMMVDATLAQPRPTPWRLGWDDAEVLLDCWRYGYCLAACAAWLPAAADAELPVHPIS